MDLIALKKKFKGSISNYRYVLIILAVGLLLMMLPTSKKEEETEKETNIAVQQISQEERLTQILQQIHGVGEVQVLLSTENSGETIYQTDEDLTETDTTQDKRTETVLITDSDRNQSALVRISGAPVYRGAVVVCQGGDLSSVKLAVTQAVIKATGLTADRICVLKMK